MNRRDFLQASAAGAACAAASSAHAAPVEAPAGSNAGKIYKSVKWGMIKTDGDVASKFALCKELGYDGMELVSPGGPSAEEARAAAEATGMPIHGVVDMRHWQIRLSSPSAETRDEGRAILEQAIRDCHAYGGDTVLLVPGRVAGDAETHDHVWNRSIPQIRKVLPTASKLGVRVLIENVWNGFCKQPDELRDYVDAIDSPWVGVYFDIGNAQRFAPSEEWVRTLGRRIVKLDVKGWGQEGGFGKIGDGDVDWPAVREALAEIGFSGWCTAEVGGGGKERLAEIADRLNRSLAL
ncbi:MAG: sugar phosphate isomerase/epimerase family protein [Planctomycetota bacterium]